MADERLVVELEARVAQFEKGLAKATANLDQFAAHADKAEKAGKRFGSTAPKSMQDTAKQAAAMSFQTRQALLQLPDIFQGIATGQGVIRVAIQQGGQLSQVMALGPGGVAGSLRIVAREMAALVTPTRLAFGAVATAGVAAGAGVISWERYATALDDLSKITGTTIADLSKLQAAASFKGVGQEDFASGMKQFAAAVYDARSGAGDLAKLLRANGQTVGDTATTFERVADLIQNAGSYQQKLNILQQAGLPTTSEFVRLMNQGAEGIRQAKQQAVEFGGAANDEMIKTAREFDEAWNRAWTNFGLQSRSAIVQAVGLISQLLDQADQFGNRALAKLAPGGLAEIAANLLKTGRGTPLGGTEVYRGFEGVRPLSSPATVDPAALQRSLTLEAQRIRLLGDLATAQDKARLKEIEIQQARLNGVNITDREQRAIVGLTSAQESLNRAQEAIGILGQAATEAEQYALRIRELTSALALGKIDQEQFNRAVAQASPAFNELKSATTDFASGFLQDIRQGTSAMDALGTATDRLIDKLIDLAANKAITSLFDSVSGGAGGGLFSLLAPTAHGGGIVGDLQTSRRVPAIAWEGALRYHSGGIVGRDEVPILARRGEGVFTPEQMQAMGGGTVVNVHVTTNISAQSTGNPGEQERLGKRVAAYVHAAVQDAMIKERASRAISAGGL